MPGSQKKGPVFLRTSGGARNEEPAESSWNALRSSPQPGGPEAGPVPGCAFSPEPEWCQETRMGSWQASLLTHPQCFEAGVVTWMNIIVRSPFIKTKIQFLSVTCIWEHCPYRGTVHLWQSHAEDREPAAHSFCLLTTADVLGAMPGAELSIITTLCHPPPIRCRRYY